MSDPWPDALFGVDGTELPVSVPDRSGRGRRHDTSPAPLPRLGRTTEEIVATAGGAPGGPAAQAPTAASAAPPMGPAPRAPQPSAGSAPKDTTATKPMPAAQQAAVTTPAEPPARPTQPIIAPGSPDPEPPRGFGALLYRWQASPGTRPHGKRRGPRRPVGQSRGVLTGTWSNGGAGTFLVIMTITFAVLLYFIISGIVEAFARLIP